MARLLVPATLAGSVAAYFAAQHHVATTEAPRWTTVQVQVVSLPGERARPGPGRLATDTKVDEILMSELTGQGVQQCYSLGLSLASRYSQIWGQNLNHSHFLFRAASQSRCIMSALMTANGLFPPSHNIGLQDILYIGCPQEKETEQPLFLQELNELEKMYELPTQKICESVRCLNPDIKLDGRHSLEHVDPVLWKELGEKKGASGNPAKFDEDDESFWMEYQRLRSDVLGSLAGPNMVKTITDQMSKVVSNDPSPPKFALYCGHDATLMLLIAGLSLDSGPKQRFDELPPPGSALVVELQRREVQDEVKHRVRVLFKDSRYPVFEALPIPACGGRESCKWEEFSDLVKNAEPLKWRQCCDKEV